MAEMDVSLLVDRTAEAGVISTLIYHPDYIYHAQNLTERCFYEVDNSCFFWAIKELVNKKITAMTALNISQIIQSHSAVNKEIQNKNIPSFQEYIDDCMYSKRDSVEEFKLLVSRVLELSFKRDLYKVFDKLTKQCFDPSNDLANLSNRIYRDLETLNGKYLTGEDITTVGSDIDDIWDEIVQIKNRGETFGFPSIYKEVNEFFHYEKTELVVIAARMKQGKSILAMMEAIHKAENGVATLLYDSEMSRKLWDIRLMSYYTGISTKDLKNRILTPAEEQRVSEAKKRIKKLPLCHIYDPYMSKEKFFSICSQKKIDMNLEFVIWDYIKCSDDIVSAGERSAYMGGITNWLKNVIAGDLNLAVLAFAQLNRGGEVAESDGIEKYCSVSVRWSEKTPEELSIDGDECGTHKMSIKLNRLGEQHNGSTEYIDMKFIGGGKLGIEEAVQHTLQDSPF